MPYAGKAGVRHRMKITLFYKFRFTRMPNARYAGVGHTHKPVYCVIVPLRGTTLEKEKRNRKLSYIPYA